MSDVRRSGRKSPTAAGRAGAEQTARWPPPPARASPRPSRRPTSAGGPPYPPSRPRPPLLRTPSVRGRNPETSRCRLATLRHVTATLRRRQFQTAEQLKAALAGPTPGPGSPPTPPRGSPPRPSLRDPPPGPASAPRGAAAACEVSGVQKEVPGRAGPGEGLGAGTAGAAGREGVLGTAGKKV